MQDPNIPACAKLRYSVREEAEYRALSLAYQKPGERFHAYKCTKSNPSVRPCAKRKSTGRVWHVGHATGADYGADSTFWVDATGRVHGPWQRVRPPRVTIAQPAPGVVPPNYRHEREGNARS